MVNLKDNTPHSLQNYAEYSALLTKYSHKSLGKLLENNNQLILCSDEIKELQRSPLWDIRDEKIYTNNLMGFIGLNHENGCCTVKIRSRFTNNDKNDYFLHYMLQKVFLGQTINLDIGTTENENFWEYYYYLFPHYLNKALAQGSYKEYVHKKYNNMNLRGSIDIKRHIRQNIPFQGKIAYNTREHSYNNRITQLIRHTIEYITCSHFGKSILNSSIEIRDNISQIEYLTHDFHHRNRQNIIQECHEKISNPYWKEYENLRQLCLKILNQDKLSFNGSEDKVHGILFDGAWLWEEYLATILTPQGFIHPDNNKKLNRIYLDKENSLSRYPDFYCNQRELILDAKYQFVQDDKRENIHQIITYMYRLKSKKGILIYPTSEKNINNKSYSLLGCGEIDNTPYCQLIHQCFHISTSKDYKNFCDMMKENEQDFLKDIQYTPNMK